MTFEPTFLKLLILFAAALSAGFVDSIAGGGGLIAVPALLAVGIPPHLALGTNKVQSSFGSSTAAIRYAGSGLIKKEQLAT
ncbi:MAG: TSUP family transporter, partial [Spirochaetales bacterium]|nr:TSUP family transporter [Spirochaetales bacterium]